MLTINFAKDTLAAVRGKLSNAGFTCADSETKRGHLVIIDVPTGRFVGPTHVLERDPPIFYQTNFDSFVEVDRFIEACGSFPDQGFRAVGVFDKGKPRSAALVESPEPGGLRYADLPHVLVTTRVPAPTQE